MYYAVYECDINIYGSYFCLNYSSIYLNFYSYKNDILNGSIHSIVIIVLEDIGLKNYGKNSSSSNISI